MPTLIEGTSGDDTLDYSQIFFNNNDLVIFRGYGGNDFISGAQRAEYFDGGDGNDTLYGGYDASDSSGFDTFNGGAGADYLSGGISSTFIGGTGIDFAAISGRAVVHTGPFASAVPLNLTIDLSAIGAASTALPLGGSIAADVEGVGLTLYWAGFTNDGQSGNVFVYNKDVYTITGSPYAEFITGSGGDDIINGAGGDDSLDGFIGNDTLYGGAGADYLDGQAGADTLYGGDGNDTLRAGDRSPYINQPVDHSIDILDGGDGNDTFYAGLGDTIIGGAGLDSLHFEFAASDTVDLDFANLVYSGGIYSGVVSGSAISGIETIDVGFGPTFDIITPGTLTFHGSIYGDSVSGSEGNDFLYGADGADALGGAGGDDLLDGGAGPDAMTGGAGNDTYIVDDANDLTIDTAGTDTIKTTLASLSLATRTAIENLTFTGAGVFSANGNALNNVIKGGGVFDTIDGGGGTDKFVADYSARSAAVVAGLSGVTVGGASVTSLTSIEAISVIGGSGADSLTGGAGDDQLDGGAGADTLIGGGGDDTYTVDNLGDVATEASGAGFDTIRAALNTYTLSANIEQMIYVGASSFIGLGNDQANIIAGGANNDYVYLYGGADSATGGGGIDVLIGGDGNDTLNGGDGQDYLFGDAGDDILNGDAVVDVLQGGAGDDVMNGGDGGDYLYGEDGNDTGNGDAGNDIFVMGNGNDIGNGGDGQDYFYMGAGDDVMNGGAGVDVMLGEAGNDTFNGGLGVDYAFLGPKGAGDNDIVVLNKTASGIIVVNDFEAGGSNDAVRLEGTGWSSFAQVQNAITDYTASGGFCILTLDADTALWFIGVAPSQLTGADFVFS